MNAPPDIPTGPLLLIARCEFDSWHENFPGMAVVKVMDSNNTGFMAVVEPSALLPIDTPT